MIDLHSHVSSGIDDGAADARGLAGDLPAAAADGITVLAATPHVRDDYPTTPDMMEARLAEVQAAVGDRIRVVPGGEFDIAELARPGEELARFGLGGNPGYLLVETPYFGWPLDFPDRALPARFRGHPGGLAHPERNPDVQERPELLEPPRRGWCARPVDGRIGRRTARSAGAKDLAALLERGLAHLVASDAHEASVREIGLSSAAAAVGDEALARYLTIDVPRAIVEGGPLPERPEPQKRRALFRGRSRGGR